MCSDSKKCGRNKRFGRNAKMFGGIGAGLIVITVIVVLVVTMTNGLTADDVVVTLPDLGSLRGSVGKSAWSDKEIYQFRGIHFAESPSGERRFKPPEPRSPWSGIKDARDHDIACPVITTLAKLTPEELESRDWEDCLHLSVYTKSFSSNLPVMFYIHGGAFINGSAPDHPPGYLLENDVVLVVTQYRFGALGFLSTNSETISGNVGILDVILALEWVQKNIHHFGGDPNRITIFGQSAGAGIVSLLTVSPAVREGLFHQVIAQSGSVFSTWGWQRNPVKKAKNIAAAGGCSNIDDMNVVNEFFMNLSVMKLLEITALEGFRPTLADLNGVLPESPKALWDKSTRTYPVMGGVTTHDGTFQLATIYNLIGKTLEESNDAIEIIDYVSTALGVTDDTGGYTSVLAMQTLFTDEQIESGDFYKMLPGLIDLSNNVIIKSPTFRFLQLNAQRRPHQTYLYTFDYAGEPTRFGYGHPTDHLPFDGGVHHSNDNIYIFPTIPLNEKDLKIAKKMSQIWTSFAIEGVPRTGDVEWPAMTKKIGPYIHINETCTIARDFRKELTVTSDDKTNSIIRPRKRSKL